MARKRHLARQSSPPIRRAACGQESPDRWSHDPAEVTCVRCSGTVLMADAEVRKQQTRKNNRLHSVKAERSNP